MKALTLHQPWASLVALGVKTIETRSWPCPPSLIGQPLVIHAALSPQGIYDLRGDCEGDTEGGWNYGYVGDYQASYCFRSSDEGTRGEAWLTNCEAGVGVEFDGPVPMGAVVATCRVAACLPICDTSSPASSDACVEVDGASLWLLQDVKPTTERRDITDQLPYGDFSPGRYAWLLEDVKSTTERCPACWGTGLVLGRMPTTEATISFPCSTCSGAGTRPPIPARGRQRVWNWEPA